MRFGSFASVVPPSPFKVSPSLLFLSSHRWSHLGHPDQLGCTYLPTYCVRACVPQVHKSMEHPLNTTYSHSSPPERFHGCVRSNTHKSPRGRDSGSTPQPLYPLYYCQSCPPRSPSKDERRGKEEEPGRRKKKKQRCISPQFPIFKTLASRFCTLTQALPDGPSATRNVQQAWGWLQ